MSEKLTLYYRVPLSKFLPGLILIRKIKKTTFDILELVSSRSKTQTACNAIQGIQIKMSSNKL